MAASTRLPRYAALCVEHRQVVGADDDGAIIEWVRVHAKVRRCRGSIFATSDRIAEIIVDRGLVEEVPGGRLNSVKGGRR